MEKKFSPGGSNGDSDAHQSEGGASTSTATRERVRTPSMYKVILLNDDYTPMEFVVHVLQKFFQKSITEATEIMLNVHHEGYGIAGVYPFEVAETKSQLVNHYAQTNNHPLKCNLEKE